METTILRRTLATIVLAVGLCAGCNSGAPGTSTPADGKPIVECTTGMVADVVRNVGGEHVTVGQLMQGDADPHLYHASPGDVSRLNAADVIFYSGLHLEGKLGEILEQLARRKPTYAVTSEMPENRLITIGDNTHDPHVWFDVSLWSETIPVVQQALASLDPAHADAFAQNAADYKSKLMALDEEVRTSIAAIPESSRVLVTAHDAFHYFARAYDMEVRAIQGVSTDVEAGVADINELVQYIIDHKIKAVFIETSLSDRNIRSLIEGCESQGHKVAIGGELYSDAMGPAGSEAGTYVGMVRHNVKTIVDSLK